MKIKSFRWHNCCHIWIFWTIDPKSLTPIKEYVTTVTFPLKDLNLSESKLNWRTFDWINFKSSHSIVEGQFDKKISSINVFSTTDIVNGNDLRVKLFLKVNIIKILFAKKEKKFLELKERNYWFYLIQFV